MVNTASQDTHKQPDSAQAQLKQMIAYKQRLSALMDETQGSAQQLNREMQRQQTMVEAALNIEGTNREKLQKEQALLNELEEQNKAALLELAMAKQKSVQAMRRYNEQLENIKKLHSHLDLDTQAALDQQQGIRSLIADWQNSSFFLQKQQSVSKELDERISALRAHLNQNPEQTLPPLSFDDKLPPLDELAAPPRAANDTAAPAPADADAPPAPQSPGRPPAPDARPAAHANANFWENEKHAAFKPAPPKPLDAADTAEAETEPAEAKKPRKSRKQLFFSYLKCVLLAVLAAFIVRTWILVPTQVSGSSMQPTLDSDDKVLTSPLPYWISSPKRGDIIVFEAPDEAEGVYYVKRVIGLPGEHIRIIDGRVYIDEQPLNEPYIESEYTGGYIDTLVPNGSFFVMGDNREVSHDSRDSDVSFIEASTISGRALWRIYPFEAFGAIK